MVKQPGSSSLQRQTRVGLEEIREMCEPLVLSGRKLPFNEHVCAYSNIDFVLSENSFFLLSPLPTWLCCELVHSQSVSCLSINIFVHIQHWFHVEWKFVAFTSFTHLLCCELVHSQPVSCLEWTCLCILNIDFVLSENLFLLSPLPACCVVNWCTLSL